MPNDEKRQALQMWMASMGIAQASFEVNQQWVCINMNSFQSLKLASTLAPWIISILALAVAAIVYVQRGKITALTVLFFAICGLAAFHFIRDGILN